LTFWANLLVNLGVKLLLYFENSLKDRLMDSN
jgi:hypothetical protein